LIWDGQTLPVPVEDIADSHFGLYVRDVEDMSAAPGCPETEGGQSISGLLLLGRKEIWVNAEEARQWPPRRRFTIGHELGRWVLHRANQPPLFCRKSSIQEGEEPDSASTRSPLPVSEEEANAFSAALLMPAPLIREHYERLGGDFDALCRLFQASGAAMGRRLHAVID
jgi:Zn-dependent peptidase ImmA (M78 family)